jgi:hypothetical protein
MEASEDNGGGDRASHFRSKEISPQLPGAWGCSSDTTSTADTNAAVPLLVFGKQRSNITWLPKRLSAWHPRGQAMCVERGAARHNLCHNIPRHARAHMRCALRWASCCQSRAQKSSALRSAGAWSTAFWVLGLRLRFRFGS